MGCPGKWKHGPKPAVCPSDRSILSHTQMCHIYIHIYIYIYIYVKKKKKKKKPNSLDSASQSLPEPIGVLVGDARGREVLLEMSAARTVGSRVRECRNGVCLKMGIANHPKMPWFPVGVLFKAAQKRGTLEKRRNIYIYIYAYMYIYIYIYIFVAPPKENKTRFGPGCFSRTNPASSTQRGGSRSPSEAHPPGQDPSRLVVDQEAQPVLASGGSFF